ncbi:hypothetical protein ACFV4P_18365 [Kitasatospora sp. NPDC059795]|uniref:hypothetical protein n=1 Tax=Kitasatospora sp. NPDC059795 TaxID=3346949 RepID=UPI003651D77E
MRESDRAGAAAGFRAAAFGLAVGLCMFLVGCGVMALRGEGRLPSSALIVAVVPVSGSLGPLWRRWPQNRRPALVVAMLLFLLVVLLSAGIAEGLGADPEPEDGLDWTMLGYLPGALLAGTVFGALAGEPGTRTNDSWLRFAGRGRRLHRAVYGGLGALLVLTVAVTVLVG